MVTEIQGNPPGEARGADPKFYRARPTKSVMGRVYFLQGSSGVVKVGWALDPEKRAKVLRREAHDPTLRIVASFAGTRRDENKVHRVLVGSRANTPRVVAGRMYWHGRAGREWFSMTADVQRVIDVVVSLESWS